MSKKAALLEQIGKKCQSTLFRTLVLMAAVGSILFGCMRGELAVVLGKAVTVCMECIGLG